MRNAGGQALVGRSIVNVRQLTREELKTLMWDVNLPALVIELDDGSDLIPCQDEEMNGRGVLCRLLDDGHEVIS